MTEKGRVFADKLIALRHELVIEPSQEIGEIVDQLRDGSRLLALITGIFDNGSRVIAGRG